MRHEPAFSNTLPANGIEDTGPPECVTHLHDLELCDMFLDAFTLEDLKDYVIEESNTKPLGDSRIMMTDLIARLKGNTDAAAIEMLDLLKRLGLKLALELKD